IVDAPADVALAQVAPGGPPGEEPVVFRVERAAHVAQALPQEALHERALVLALSDGAGFELLGVDIAIGQRDVEITADDQLPAAVPHRARPGAERFEE